MQLQMQLQQKNDGETFTGLIDMFSKVNGGKPSRSSKKITRLARKRLLAAASILRKSPSISLLIKSASVSASLRILALKI